MFRKDRIDDSAPLSLPSRCLYVHGFALDEEGHKMSKSLGNVVDPWIVTDGGTNTQKDPVYGADALR